MSTPSSSAAAAGGGGGGWTQVYLNGLNKPQIAKMKAHVTKATSRAVIGDDETSIDGDMDIVHMVEYFLTLQYHLTCDAPYYWAGPGSTVLKQTKMKGGSGSYYAFLAFFTIDGARQAIETINNNYNNNHNNHNHNNNSNNQHESASAEQLHAELCQPKPKKTTSKNGSVRSSNSNTNNNIDHHVRLRRQRKAPVAKHPVRISSSGKKTNLGNKTR